MAKIDKLSKYGWGLSLFEDFSTNLKHSSGKELVLEAVAGRVLDDLWYDPNYNTANAMKRLRGPTDQYSLNSIAKDIENDILKDDRIGDVDVSITYDATTNQVTININGSLAFDDQPFDLVVGINSLNPTEISFQ